MKCSICGKNIIGSDIPVCWVCSNGISPEAISKKEKEVPAETLTEVVENA